MFYSVPHLNESSRLIGQRLLVNIIINKTNFILRRSALNELVMHYNVCIFSHDQVTHDILQFKTTASLLSWIMDRG